MTNEQKYQIAELRQFGYGYASIADALGLTKNQVSAYCRRAGSPHKALWARQMFPSQTTAVAAASR